MPHDKRSANHQPHGTPDPLGQLLTLNSPTPIGFAEVCDSLYDSRFTGLLVIHFQNGQPREIEIPRPVKLKLSPA